MRGLQEQKYVTDAARLTHTSNYRACTLHRPSSVLQFLRRHAAVIHIKATPLIREAQDSTSLRNREGIGHHVPALQVYTPRLPTLIRVDRQPLRARPGTMDGPEMAVEAGILVASPLTART